MPARQIVRELNDIAGTVARAKAECVKWRSDWHGDETGGEFVIRLPVGTLFGSYSVEGSIVCFVVEKKPVLLPHALIERVLDEFLGAARVRR